MLGIEAGVLSGRTMNSRPSRFVLQNSVRAPDVRAMNFHAFEIRFSSTIAGNALSPLAPALRNRSPERRCFIADHILAEPPELKRFCGFE